MVAQALLPVLTLRSQEWLCHGSVVPVVEILDEYF